MIFSESSIKCQHKRTCLRADSSIHTGNAADHMRTLYSTHHHEPIEINYQKQSCNKGQINGSKVMVCASQHHTSPHTFGETKVTKGRVLCQEVQHSLRGHSANMHVSNLRQNIQLEVVAATAHGKLVSGTRLITCFAICWPESLHLEQVSGVASIPVMHIKAQMLKCHALPTNLTMTMCLNALRSGHVCGWGHDEKVKTQKIHNTYRR